MRIRISRWSWVLVLVALGLPFSEGFQGFDDDTGEVCLGADDPFCNDEGGGSGWTPTCWSCDWGHPQPNPVKCKKSSSVGYQVCTITHSGTSVSCSESGGQC